jgi:hypothetical protein
MNRRKEGKAEGRKERQIDGKKEGMKEGKEHAGSEMDGRMERQR